MTTWSHRYTSEFARRYFDAGNAVGVVKGLRKHLLKLREVRGVELTSEARELISRCADADLFELWIDRAATATTSAELFSML